MGEHRQRIQASSDGPVHAAGAREDPESFANGEAAEESQETGAPAHGTGAVPVPVLTSPSDEAGSSFGEPGSEPVQLLLSLGMESARRDLSRAIECYRSAVELARAFGQPRAEARGLVLLGSAELKLGNQQAAETALERGRALIGEAREREALELSASCLNQLGLLRLRQGNLQEAASLLGESLDRTSSLTREGRPPAARTECLELLAMVAANRGDFATSLRTYQDALTMQRLAGDTVAVARTLNQVGNLRHRMGSFQEAVECYRESMALHEQLKEDRAVAAIANNLASTLLRLGELREARSLFEDCRRRFREMGEPARSADALSNLGLVAQAAGQLEEADRFHREGLELRRELKDLAGEARSLVNLSYLALMRGECELALERAGESLERFRKAGLSGTLAPALVARGLASFELGQTGEALRTAAEALCAAEGAGAKDQICEALMLRGRALLEEGEEHAFQEGAEEEKDRDRLDAALQDALAAGKLAEEAGDPEMLAAACRVEGNVRFARREYEESKLAYARAGRILRGWDESFERACVAFDEGVLLAEVGAAEAAAERFRRVEMVFARIGNPRWRIRSLHRLADVLQASDPAQSASLRDIARGAATAAGLEQFEEKLRRSLANASEAPAAHVRHACGDRRDDGSERRLRRLAGVMAQLRQAASGTGAGVKTIGSLVEGFLKDELGVSRCHVRLDSPDARTQTTAERILIERASPLDAEELAIVDILESVLDLQIGAALHPPGRRSLDGDGDGAFRAPGAGELDGPAEAALESSFERAGDHRTGEASHEVDEGDSVPTAPRAPKGSSDAEAAAADAAGEPESAGEPADAAGEPVSARAPGRSPRPSGSTKEPDGFELLVGASRPMREVYRLVQMAARTDATVLVLGESGTGKELVARSLHARSPRSGKPFVAISCPSIPRDLLESELFGHERGAFTGATEARPGKIELANSGTLFLDEIGDMPSQTQVKLLRFLQEREFERVGGRRSISVDVRVVAATSRDLQSAMEEGTFRSDLYYRLSVVPLRVPPLRERRQDIPPLVHHFLRTLHPAGEEARIAEDVLEVLLAHAWPGNVRELRNVVEYMTTVAEGGRLEVRHLPSNLLELSERLGSSGRPVRGAVPEVRPGESLESRLMELEASLIRRSLEQEGWNQSAAARRLGITESKIRNRMKLYGITGGLPPTRAGGEASPRGGR